MKQICFKKHLWVLLKLCCTLVFVFASTSIVYAQTSIDIRTKMVTLGFSQQPLEDALLILEKVSGFQLTFPNEPVEAASPITLPEAERTVEATLHLLLQGSNLDFQVLGNNIVLSVKRESDSVATAPTPTPTPTPTPAVAVQHHITGRIICNMTRETMPLVTVAIKGTTTGVITSMDGEFTIDVPSADAVLVFSFLGYETLELPVVVGRRMEVRMNTTATELEAIVITGYQVLSKREQGGAVTVLKSEDIQLLGRPTIDEMLQAGAPGMNVQLTSGEPGETSQIRIRGNATLSSNAAPLWVVDGVILEQPVPFDASDINSGDAAYLVGNAIAGLNPEDIETITILRDASATAIYGVRAANGVIVITTRRGAVGTPRVEYTANIQFTQRNSYSRFDRMNSLQRVELSREVVDARLRYRSIPSGSTYEGALRLLMNKEITQAEFEQMVSEMQTRDTDWFKELSRPEVTQAHRVAVSGGSPMVRYFFSAGYNDTKSGTIGSSSQRFNTLGKLNASFGKWLDVEGKMAYRNSKNSGYNGVNPFDYAYTTSRTIPLRNEDGTFHRHLCRRGYLYNIMEELENTGSTGNVDGFESLLAINARLIEGLTYRSMFSYNITNTQRRSWATDRSNNVANQRGYNFAEYDEASALYHASELPYGGTMEKSNINAVNWSIRNALEYRQAFGDHSIHVFGAVEARSNRHVGDAVTGYGWNPIFGEIFMPVYTDRFVERYVREGRLNPRTTNSVMQVASFMSTFGYGFQSKYVLNASIRSDGSNRFGHDPKYRWLPTWMLSGRWNINEERFVKDNAKWLNNLALRVSYGLQGNLHDHLTPDLVVRFANRDSRSGLEVYNIHRLPNPELRWERSNSWNAGLDFTILKNRLQGGVDAFYRYTSDLIMDRFVPTNNGRARLFFNAGEMVSEGIEGFLRYTIINNAKWMFRFGATAGHNRSQIMLASMDDFNSRDQMEMMLAGNVAIEGAPVGALYSFRFAGLSSANGYPLFYGRSEEGEQVMAHMGLPENFDLVYSGSIFPTLYGGFDFNVQYRRRLTLSLGFTYNVGNVKRLPSIFDDSQHAPDPMRNFSTKHLNRWRQPGDENHTNLPVFYNEDVVSSFGRSLNLVPVGSSTGQRYPFYFYDRSDLQVAKADFLKFRSLRLSYDFPKDMAKTLKLSSARLNFQILNLFTFANKRWEGIDPESANARVPNLPSYTMGVAVTF